MLNIEDIEHEKKKMLSRLDDFETNDLRLSNIINKKELVEDNNNLRDSLLNDKINNSYFTKEEKDINKYNDRYQQIVHIILVVIGFIILILCGIIDIYILIPEIVLNLCLPYIYIPVKVLLCQSILRDNIKKIYIVLFK